MVQSEVLLLRLFCTFNDQCSYHMETIQLIWSVNHLTGIYIMGTMVIKRSKRYDNIQQNITAQKASTFTVFLVGILSHLDWISVFSPNVGKYGPEKLQTRTLSTQCMLHKNFHKFPQILSKITCDDHYIRISHVTHTRIFCGVLQGIKQA